MMAFTDGNGRRPPQPPGLRLNVYERALAEPRIKRVARRMNLSEFDVLGRMNHLWMLCYRRVSEFVDVVDADIVTGELPGFLDTVIAEKLADRVSETEIRVCGAEDAVSLLVHTSRISELQSEKGKKSGVSRRAVSEELQNRTAVQHRFEFGSEPDGNRGSTAVEPLTDYLTGSDPPNRSQQIKNSPLLRGSTGRDAKGGDAPGPRSGDTPDVPSQHSANGEHVEPAGRPLPTPPPQAVELARLLHDSVVANNPSGRLAQAAPRLHASTIARWADTIRLLHERDRIEWKAIADMIRWCQADTFWRSNILGADNLRKQWDHMAMQRQRKPGNGRHEARPGPSELARQEVEQLERAQGSGKAR